MRFPHHDEPDGDRMAPHHFLIGLWAYLAAVIAQTHEPMLGALGALTALFGWYHAWYLYPRLGASLSGVGLTVAFFGLLSWPRLDTWLVLAFLGWIAALDDYWNHATGMETPLNWFWERYLARWLFGALDRLF